MTLPNLLSWIANSTKKRARGLLIRASAARSAAGRPAKKTSGLVPAGMNGTPLIPEACAPPASISGLQLSASPVSAGRRIRIGMRNRKDRGHFNCQLFSANFDEIARPTV